MDVKINLMLEGLEEKKVSSSPSNRVHIRSPAEFDLYLPEAQYESLLMVKGVRQYCLIERKYILIDLSEMVRISACAALILFSEISAAQISTGKPNIVRLLWPTSREVLKILYLAGFRRAVGIGSLGKLDLLIGEKSKYASGTDVEAYVTSIETYLDRLVPSSTSAEKVFFTRAMSAISEALLNVKHHAYEDADRVKHPANVHGRFWTFIDVADGYLAFCLYDMGRGIPASLQSRFVSEDAKQLLGKAMTRGISRTLLPERGKGSEDMKKPVTRAADTGDDEGGAPAHLFIISGEAQYRFRSDSLVVELSGINPGLVGTYLEWNIPL